jgi:hypothetical protein
MDYSVCSRETERDYAWDNTHASYPVSEYAQSFFAPALEGSITTSRFVGLLRSSGSSQGVVLGVSASTARRDFTKRPIRSMAFLRAETPDETNLLTAFFAECLRKPDKETLYKAESGVAKAVESLYQTKKPDDFLRFCRSLPAANGSGAKPTGRCGIPRDDVGSRQAMAESLPALVRGGEPFLIALTDRRPTDVLASLGSMFDHVTVHIFSKEVSEKAPLPGGGPNTRVIAATIGGVILLSALIVAAGRSCRNTGEDGKADGETNIVNCADGGGGATTKAVPLGGRSGEFSRETRQGDSPTNDDAVKAGAKLSVQIEGQPQRFPADDSNSSSEDHIHQRQ